MPLSCPRTEQPHYLKVSVIHIQTGAEYFFQIKRLFSLIADCRRSCYGILIPKYRIPKHHLHSQNRIPCQKTQCNTILLISPCCRKSRKFRLSFLDLIPFINQFACSVTGHTSDTDPACACDNGICCVASYCACAVRGKLIPAFP